MQGFIKQVHDTATCVESTKFPVLYYAIVQPFRHENQQRRKLEANQLCDIEDHVIYKEPKG